MSSDKVSRFPDLHPNSCLCHCHRRTKFLLLHPKNKGLVINAIGSIIYMFFKSSLHGILLTHHGHMLIMDIMDLNEQCHAENGNLWISPISKDVRDASHESFVRNFVPGYLSYEDVEAQRDGDVFLMLNPLKSNIDIHRYTLHRCQCILNSAWMSGMI